LIGKPFCLPVLSATPRHSPSSCPSASPEYEGQGADSLNVELAKFLTKLFASPCGASLDLSKLCLAPGLQCWVLYVDVLVLSSSGNLFDAASIACRAALADTRIPKVNVVMAEAGLVEIEIADDPDEYTLLDVSRVPICITHTLISPNGVPVLDTTIEEENCMRARLSVGVNKAGTVFAIQLGGQGSLSKDLFNMVIQSARRVGIQLCLGLDKLCSQDIARKPADIGQIF
jgi:exosome complex component RRP42